MNKKTYVPLLFIVIVVLLVGTQLRKDNVTEQPEKEISNVLNNSDEINSDESNQDEQKEQVESNILDDYKKRAEAEAFILTTKGEALEEAYSSGTTMLYYDPESLVAYVDDELTNLYIKRQLIYDVDPEKEIEQTKELYLNHYYSVVIEYVAEYDPLQFSVVDGEEGLLRVKMEYMVLERNGKWEIYSNQYRGSVPVSDDSNSFKSRM